MENHSIIVNACTTFSSSLTFLNVSKELATISGLAVNLIHGILIHNPKVLLRGENRLSNFDFGINNLEMRKRGTLGFSIFHLVLEVQYPGFLHMQVRYAV